MTTRHPPRIALAAAALFSLAATGAASAQTRPALQQVTEITTDLGQNASAVTYWIRQSEGWHVVTTVDSIVGEDTQSAQSRHAVVRFTVNMLPGQSQLVSVPGPAGVSTPSLRIRRLGDRIEVTRVQDAS
jgi:hypothetical protein